MPSKLQPFLHNLVTAFAAPTQTLSDPSGNVASTTEIPSAQGFLHSDIRVLSKVRLLADGHSPEHIATTTGPGTATFTSVLRRTSADLGSIPDPQLRLDRTRTVTPGRIGESITISSVLTEPVTLELELQLASDFAAIESIKSGQAAAPQVIDALIQEGSISWSHGDLDLVVSTASGQLTASPDRTGLTLTWQLRVPARSSVTADWQLEVTDSGGAVVAATTPAIDVDRMTGTVLSKINNSAGVEYRLEPWLRQSLADLNSLRMATAAAPNETFFAAGSPWYLTLFGRDSIWAARLLLPYEVDHAAMTLRTLARLQGSKINIDTAEEPGKIMHELRRAVSTHGDAHLPPLYYGTIDATPLWICLLHDAWKAGMPDEAVRELLPNLQAALQWLADHGDADGDGFLEYIDTSGHGLANQGWKDSGDSVRFADGTIAEGPVALCEVQGYAHEAAVSGAALLDAFGLDGGDHWRDWAAALASRFRASFWCNEGDDPYPALALDGSKRRVDSVTSNIGHLLGTGILQPDEERLVADRLCRPDLDSGLGLRTMSTTAAGYSPLSYHCGSVWPHDTAIVISSMLRAGLAEQTTGLVEGLLRASVTFDQRLGELWSGEGLAGVPYPASCRPQAWSAAAAVTVAQALGDSDT